MYFHRKVDAAFSSATDVFALIANRLIGKVAVNVSERTWPSCYQISATLIIFLMLDFLSHAVHFFFSSKKI
jgi:hypothetical protein